VNVARILAGFFIWNNRGSLYLWVSQKLSKMSEMNTHIGKLKLVDFGAKTKSEFISGYVQSHGLKIEPGYKNVEDLFLNECYEKFVVIGDLIYEILENKSMESDCDINFLVPNADGTITFIEQFYNGGTCLNEALEHGLKKLNNP
jgi:hypothetical protein